MDFAVRMCYKLIKPSRASVKEASMNKRALCPGHSRRSFPRPIAVFIFLVFSVFFHPLISFSEDTVTLESTGTAAVSSSNAALARDAAVADALRKAVEQAAGAFVTSETLVENFQLLSESVYSNAAGYVKSYSIISEGSSGGLYYVTVRAAVKTGDLSGDIGDLGLLHQKAARPRVLFMMEEHGPEVSGGYWWAGTRSVFELNPSEAALKKAFIDRGFNAVEITAAELDKLEKYPEISGQAARMAGAAMDAEVVIFGRSKIEEGPSTGATSVVNYLASMTAQAVRVDDGVVLASARGRGTSRNISSEQGRAVAVEKAAAVVAEGLIAQIKERWAGPQTVRVTLKDMDYREAAEFKRFLRTRVRGVQAIYQRRHTGRVIVLELETASSAQAIADDISRHGKYRVTGATSNTIEVEEAQ